MVPPDFLFDPTELNHELGVVGEPDLALQASDARFLWPLAYQLISCTQGQFAELLAEVPPVRTVGRHREKKGRRVETSKRGAALIHAGLLTKDNVQIVPHRLSGECLYSWRPGDPPPAADELAAKIKTAWKESTVCDPRLTPASAVYQITDRGAALVGGFRGVWDAAELKRHGLRCEKLACGKHEVYPSAGDVARSRQAITEVYFTLHLQSRDIAGGWRLLHRSPTELLIPDAVVYDSAGSLSHAVVYATHWCGCIVKRFHEICSTQDMPYRIYGA